MKIGTVQLFAFFLLFVSCSKGSDGPVDNGDGDPVNEEKREKVVYDETGLAYTSYTGLVMAGYQGWFNTPDDGANRGWTHYTKGGCTFGPGCVGVDFWPDVTEYTKLYDSPFRFEDGSIAQLPSSYDYETVDLHFKWMKEYGIDGVYLQRFISQLRNPGAKNQVDKVFEHVLKAANKYGRAVSLMYDLSGLSDRTGIEADLEMIVEDWESLQEKHDLFNHVKNPSYLRHNGQPLLALWGIGFRDRRYSTANIKDLINRLQGEGTKKYSLLLGVPYHWRELRGDAENNVHFHTLIKEEADVIMPWAVNRYNSGSYNTVATPVLKPDITWCDQHNIDYAPLVFPGFSWANLYESSSNENDRVYDGNPRLKGDFFWMQIAGAKTAGAKSLYIAMFDEIDEGTAIFKCATSDKLPLNGDGRFVGIDPELGSDHYLWLAGEATKWIKGNGTYTSTRPVRTAQ
ncbi:glycoside hydrolase family 71/99-like protein [Sphingobacterium haloxyli]|uniref:Xylosidase n=1 Tax=Sphingobacterium haloxyli TaxID=2100533 RepID=A0A2S9J7Y2_9SPHI|nr:glycoside hydrolase family 71/99-like protein [Sphingobacterium haloxyli]PRD48881.1 xylosidase [Sphingobacterium haloxyli]